ncbi:MAG: RluA family pseudouridine synthase [Deltaproteobacteria bacterium]|nr:RluA family pseudouridine synthase [Deltaproteobacteria bacterium]
MSHPPSDSTRLVVGPLEAGERIDRFLASMSSLSRRGARALLRQSSVLRNGKILRIEGRILEFGDVVDVHLPPDQLEAPRTPALPTVDLVHQDGWVLAANKPAGTLSQPSERRQEGELALDEQLALQLAVQRGRPPFLRLIHRLDRVTSGLLLFAADRRALAPLAAAWRSRDVGRTYLAVVEGSLEVEKQHIEAPIAKARGGGWKFEVSSLGQESETEVTTLASNPDFSLVKCQLVTGRTHQVRVHLAHLGFPVLGDRLYGSRSKSASRPLLHASELSLPHPRSGEQLRLHCPAPEDFTPFTEATTVAT